jgi:hypothetical protein
VTDDLDDIMGGILAEHDALIAAVRAGGRFCPFCGNSVEVLERGRRISFSGWEEASIQYACEPCGIYGEAGLNVVGSTGSVER